MLLHLTRVRDDSAPTMWTDGKQLGYNPAFVDSITDDELLGVLAHEVLHVASLHPWRRDARHNGKWNIACDAVINDICTASGFKLPKGCVPGVKDKSAEEVYNTLPDPPPNQGGGFGEVRDANNNGKKLTEAERESQMAEARVRTQQAANAAKAAGKTPAGLNRLLDEMMEPRIPWKDLLSRFLDTFSRSDYSWSRPNRRYLQGGVILPSLWSQTFGEIIVACDTSGSISPQMLTEVCSEVFGCLNTYCNRGEVVELTLLWCDTEVSAQSITDISEIRPVGGGGTDFAPVFKWVKDSKDHDPRALIYMTDGYCNSFGEKPDYPVLWILTEPNSHFKPPFGEIASIMNT